MKEEEKKEEDRAKGIRNGVYDKYAITLISCVSNHCHHN